MKNKIKLLNDHLSISFFNLSIFQYIFFILIFNFHISIVYSQTPKLIGPPSSAIDIYINQQDPSIIYASNFAGGLFKQSKSFNTEVVLTLQRKAQIVNIFYSNFSQKTFFYAYEDFIKGSESHNDWKIIYNDSHYGPYSKHFIVNPLNENVMYMHRHGKEIWRSNDNGENWYLLHTFDDDFGRIAISPTDTSILYAAIGNDLYKSTDSGKNWFKPFDISFTADADNLIVNPQNPHSVYLQSVARLFKAVDKGTNVDTLLYNNVVDFIIDPKDSLIMYVTSYPGGLTKSIDGGQSWFNINNGLPDNGTDVNKLAIDPINTNIVYASTSTGIYKTIDGGENWEFINLVNDGDIYNYEVLNGGKGEIIFLSGNWHVVKTKDFGNTWSKSIFEPQENNWDINTFSMAFNPEDKNYGYLGDGTYLFKTTDGGSTWIKTDDISGSKWLVYNQYYPKIIYILTADKRLYVTEDGGNSWIELPDGYSLPIVFSPEDERVGLYPSDKGIFKTKDMGRTWQFFDEGYPVGLGIFFFDVVENNPSVVYGATPAYFIYRGALSKSLDGGESWFRIDSTLIKLDPMISVHSVCIDQENPNRLFIGVIHGGNSFTNNVGEGGLYLTEDDCKTWRKIFDSQADKIKIDYTTEPNTIYFTTKFGLMSLPDTAHVTDIKKLTEIPKQFELYQNYPNPFNPTTIIEYSLKEAGIVKLNVFNTLGEEIKTLVNKFQEKGNYSVKFDASKLSSGIYYYRISVNDFVSVKKMILTK